MKHLLYHHVSHESRGKSPIPPYSWKKQTTNKQNQESLMYDSLNFFKMWLKREAHNDNLYLGNFFWVSSPVLVKL